MIEDMKGKIRVYCRARPLSNSEKERVRSFLAFLVKILNNTYSYCIYDNNNTIIIRNLQKKWFPIEISGYKADQKEL